MEDEMRIKKGLHTLSKQNWDITQFMKGMTVLADIDTKHKIDVVIRTLEHQQVIIDDIKVLLK